MKQHATSQNSGLEIPCLTFKLAEILCYLDFHIMEKLTSTKLPDTKKLYYQSS